MDGGPVIELFHMFFEVGLHGFLWNSLEVRQQCS